MMDSYMCQSLSNRKKYTNAFMLKVINSGLNEGKRKTSRKYGISESLVRRWITKKEKIIHQVKHEDPDKEVTNISSIYSNDIDQQIYLWFKSWNKHNGKVVKRDIIIRKAKKLYAESDYKGSFNGNYWYQKWKCKLKKIREKDQAELAVTTEKNASHLPHESDVTVSSENLASSTPNEKPTHVIENLSCKTSSMIFDKHEMVDGNINEESFNDKSEHIFLQNVETDALESLDYSHDKNKEISEKPNYITVFQSFKDSDKASSSEVYHDFQERNSEISGNSRLFLPQNDLPDSSLDDMIIRRKKGEYYLPEFKLKVVNYANLHSFKETADKFSVHHSTVSEWSRVQKNMDKIDVNFLLDPEEELLKWLRLCNEKSAEISSNSVKAEVEKCLRFQTTQKNSQWLLHWHQKMKNDDEVIHDFEANGGKSMKLVNYPTDFKLEIIKYAENHTISSVSQTFFIARKCISSWKKNKEKFLNPNKKKSGRTVLSSSADEEVFQWYSDFIEKHGTRPKSEAVREKASEIFNARNITNFKTSFSWYKRWCNKYGILLRYEHDDLLIEWILSQFDLNKNVSQHKLQLQAYKLISKVQPDFKSSAGWVIRFCKRNAMIVSQIPPVTYKLPVQMENKISDFKINFMKLKTDYDLSYDCIGCMDEIPLNFSNNCPTGFVSRKLPTFNRDKLLMRRPGMESCQASFIISLLLDGTLLPPMIILKGDPSESEHKPQKISRVLVIYQENGIMDVDSMLLWIENAYKPYVKSKSLLIMDSYECHENKLVNGMLKSHDIISCIIPPGCSCKLSPFDTGIKNLFQKLLDGIIVLKSQFKNSKYKNYYSSDRPHVLSQEEIINICLEIFSKLQSESILLKKSLEYTCLLD